MKICVLARGVPDKTSPLNGMYEWGLAVTLARSGYETVVVAVDLRRGKNRKKCGLAVYEKEGVRVFDYGLPVGRINRRAAARLRLAVIAKIYAAMEKEGGLPDLSWVFFCRTFGSVAYGLAERFRVPYAVSEYESRLISGELPLFELKRYSRYYDGAIARTVPNEAFGRQLNSVFGCGFTVLPQTVGFSAEKIPHEGYVFLSIGALKAEKGMDVVIRAFAKVRKEAPCVKLVIAGDGEEKRHLEEQIKALNVENCVSFRPLVSGNVCERIAECDCFVLAPRKELIGSIYLAPLAAGIPVITTACFSASGLIPDFAGRIVPCDDAVALAEAMKEACSVSPYDGERISRYAKNTFSPAAIAFKIAEMLKESKNSLPAADI